MLAVSSSEFLNEFTIYANKAHDEKEIFIIQRANDKNAVLLSLAEYNELKKQLFLLQKNNNTTK